MKTHITPILAVLIALAFAVPANAANQKVEMKGMKFVNSTIQVAAGDTITFTNRDSVPHSATAKDGSFDTGILDPGQSMSVTIAQAGTVGFVCILHRSMKGKVVAK